MVISDEISDFGNMNFRFWKYEFQICQFAYEEWRIESTRAYFPDGFHEARIGPKGTKNHRSVKFGNRGSFLVRKVPKNTCLCYLICESNEYQMKICHMENITNLSCWKKNSRLFRFSFGDRNLGTKHTQETHTMNLSGDIGRKSGFSYESKRYFDEAKYPWRFCAGKIWRETKGKSRGPFYVGPNQRNVCETAEEMSAGNICEANYYVCFFMCLAKKRALVADIVSEFSSKS